MHKIIALIHIKEENKPVQHSFDSCLQTNHEVVDRQMTIA